MNKEFDRLRAIKLFITIAKEGSFTKAAKVMVMSPSNASKEISYLEDELGVKLLFRTTRKVGLTENGRKYLEGAKQIVTKLELLSDSLHKKKAKPKGLLRITAPSAWGQIVLAPLLAKYKIQYPDVALEIDLSNRVVDIVGESFDVAIRSTELVDSSFYAMKLTDENEIVCASKKYLEKFGSPSKYSDLKNHNCVILMNGSFSFSKWQFYKNQKTYSVNVKGNFKANDIRTVLSATRAGVGICHMPYYLVADDLKKGKLVSLFDEMKFDKRGIYAFYREKREFSPKLDSFLTFLEKNKHLLYA